MNSRLTAPRAIASLIAERREGWTLPQPFFRDPAIYERDLQRIWRTGWLFAGHSCEIANPGDYFLVELDTDSVIVVRGHDGAIYAHHNVCRHRGSLICDAASGHLTKLVCPYHQWTYGLDGTLVGWRGMQPELNKAEFNLLKVHVRDVEGLIFISLAAKPQPFEPAHEALAPLAKPQGFNRARVARSVDYIVKANWKIVWENNRECYHCNVNHPQYIKANFDHYNADDVSPRIRQQMSEASAKVASRWAAQGIATHDRTGMTLFPDAKHGIWYSANRTPLVDGWLSESMDGQLVAPRMGDYQDDDVGTLRIRSLPNFWNHSSCDHAVSTRLLPAGPELTAIRVWWLVDETAVEGNDYDLARLMPFWQLTSEQDWIICERQQRGINSHAYQQGPYSTYKEYNVEGFVKWYLDMIA
jgi:Rieske 2Fe-2S family protein